MKLTDAEIRALLDRYEAAETSLEEEAQLRKALSDQELNVEFHPYRRWFAGLDVIAGQQVLAKAGPWTDANEATGSSTAPKLAVVHRAARVPRAAWWSIAALFLIALCAGLYLVRDATPTEGAAVVATEEVAVPIDWSKYEITDPEEAARVTRAALVQVSQHLHRGSELTAEELSRMEPIHLIVNPNRKS